MEEHLTEYLSTVRRQFSNALEPQHLHDLSSRLQIELKERLQQSDISMLPSYHHTLPSGSERGTFLALDVGGSNFRLALIDLNGRTAKEKEEDGGMHVRHSLCFPIDASVRALRGKAFFEWMADRIEETLDTDEHRSVSAATAQKPLLMGLAWSFPIEQTSARSGYLLAMGKGFSATVGVQGQDLCELIMEPCLRRGLNVKLQSLVNDSSATLLSQAYRESTTRMSLILGTGTNSSIYLPVAALHPRKYGERPSSWYKVAKHVLINTELSMHGKDIWPKTRWDAQLLSAHQMPDFQPFEHFVGGLYLGEIVRLILLEAIVDHHLFDGRIPNRFSEPYHLQSSLLATFESDTTPNLTQASKSFTTAHSMHRSPTTSELQFIRDICILVSTRAAAYEATAIHALWELRAREEEAVKSQLHEIVNGTHSHTNNVALDEDQLRVTIACNGSILEKYPSFLQRCQGFLDQLTDMSMEGKEYGESESNVNGRSRRLVELSMAKESSMFGAAVAAACCGEESDEIKEENRA